MSWWKERTAREKMILGVAGILLIALMYYSIIYSPLRDSVALKQQRLANEISLASWLVSVVPEVQRLQGSKGENSSQSSGSLLSDVDQTSKAAGLGKAVTRLQPEGEKEVRAWLDAAPFNETLRWLRTLESSYGVEIAELSFNRDNEAGLVKARITFKRP